MNKRLKHSIEHTLSGIFREDVTVKFIAPGLAQNLSVVQGAGDGEVSDERVPVQTAVM